MIPLKQSTALTVPFFAHDVNGDAVTGLADGDFTKRICKAGGAWGAMTVTISEGENGWYFCPLGTGHTDTVGPLAISLSASSCKRVNLLFNVSVRVADDLAFPATSGRSLDVDASGRTLLQPTQTGVTIPTVTTLTGLTASDVNAIKLKTDNLPASPAAVGSAMTLGTDALTAAAVSADAANKCADALLARDIGSGTNAGTLNERTVRSALRFIRNKWAVVTGTLTVNCEDDSTAAWTATVGTDASAAPIVSNDPA